MPTDTDTAGTPKPSPTSGARWKWVAALAALAAVMVVSATAVAVNRGGDGNPTLSIDSQQIADSRDACQQWLDDYPTSTGPAPDEDWCNDFGDWMFDQMTDGSMIGTMMRRMPEAMIDACLLWTGTAPGDTTATGAATSSTGWCHQMVTWMTQHVSDWDDWDDWDDHMNDGPWNGMMNR